MGVLLKAIMVFEKVAKTQRVDGSPKLEKYLKRLEKMGPGKKEIIDCPTLAL